MMIEYTFATEDKFKGFMFALQQIGYVWLHYDERLGIHKRPIADKDFDLYAEHGGNIKIILDVHEEGINWGETPVFIN